MHAELADLGMQVLDTSRSSKPNSNSNSNPVEAESGADARLGAAMSEEGRWRDISREMLGSPNAGDAALPEWLEEAPLALNLAWHWPCPWP